MSYETEDVDIARGHLLALNDVPAGGLLDVLKETGIAFVKVPPEQAHEGALGELEASLK